MKTCTKCRKRLPLEAFQTTTNGNGILFTRATCKVCMATRKREWLAAKAAGTYVKAGATPEGPRPCDNCYRLDRCSKELFECASFVQWTDTGTYTPAFMGMGARSEAA